MKNIKTRLNIQKNKRIRRDESQARKDGAKDFFTVKIFI